MAVVHCKEIVGRDASQDNLQRKRYSRTFQVITSDPTDSAAVVLAFASLPALNSVYETTNAFGLVTGLDTDAVCVERRPEQRDPDNLQNWTVVCEYVGRGDPTLEPAAVSWATIKYQRQTRQDALNKWVRNSVGDFYESGLTRDRSRFAVTIKKNVLTWDPATAKDFIDTTNAFTFLATEHPPGFEPGTAKLADLAADAVYLPDNSAVHYWVRTARVEIDPDGWQAHLLDEGFHQLQDIPLFGPVRMPIYLAGGGKPSSPVPLDGAGKPLATTDPPPEGVFNDFDPYPSADWSGLALGYP